MQLKSFITDSIEIAEADALIRRFKAYLATRDIDISSYHVVIEHLRRVQFETGFVYHSFPQDWVDHYAEERYFEDDPIIGASLNRTDPFFWSEIEQITELTEAQKDFLADLRSWGLINGLAIPIHDARGVTAYFGLSSTLHDMQLEEADVLELQYGCHQMHRRFMELHGEMIKPRGALSKRELEVLHWVARGKSNSVIADILGISEHTVSTLVRRSFQKLDVSDRISATLKAVGMGLVRL